MLLFVVVCYRLIPTALYSDSYPTSLRAVV
nr:MAG TPA: hypothetical protein [Caudoviricetes sp.]